MAIAITMLIAAMLIDGTVGRSERA